MKLETERLVLRPYSLKDAKDLIKNINDLKVSRYVSSIPYPYGQKDAMFFLKKSIKKSKKKKKEDYEFGIELKSNKKIIGAIGLHKIDKFNGTAEIGYWLGRKYWKQKLMSEAVMAMLNFSFNKLKLRRIELRAYVNNIASNALAKKFGFKLEGTIRKAIKSKATGVIHNGNIYGLLREEWKQHRKKLK